MITEKQIQEVQRIVVAEAKPERLYLFGSLVTGKQHKDSDMDLLVVVPSILDGRERLDIAAHLSLKTMIPGLIFPKDILVYSKKEYEELKVQETSFLYHLLKAAKPLYVKG
jgi:predicted nucleotidyltransferase